jgi:protein TonB
MFEDNGITPLPHRMVNKDGLALPLAVSAVVHIALVAVLLYNATNPGIREEMVEVFVIGEAASSKPGMDGETGLPGTSPAAGSSQSKPVQITAAPKVEKQRVADINRYPAPTKQSSATGTAEPVRTPPAEQIASPLNLPRRGIEASLGSGGSTAGASSDKGAAGMGTGNGSGNGSAGFGSGTGGGGTGSGGILSTRFGLADAPLFKYRELPRYPVAARRRGEEGKVLLRLTIDAKGILVNVEVMESTGADFTEAAVDAVKRSSFVPAKRNNAPIMSMALLPLRFELKP